MLQKILVVLVGLVMSIVGALAPSGLFAATETGGADLDAVAGASETVLATVRDADSAAFAKLGVLWIEVDGRRVTDDAWGTGQIQELRFQVGVKNVEGLSLKVGDKLVPVRPTDTITIRTFEGDFAFRDLASANPTLQLQGDVKTTLVNPGSPTGKLTTASGSLPSPDGQRRAAAPGEVDRVAFVVLGTGKSVDTVSVTLGGDRLYTEDLSGGADASGPSAGNLLVKWVKIDGKAVQEYTWGNGKVDRIEFEPAGGDARVVSLHFGAKDVGAPKSAQVLVRDFIGEYLVYQVSGGQLRLRLDGYAANITTGAAGGGSADPSSAGTGIPIAAFEAGPDVARTTDVITFKDRSVDEGLIVFWRWDFGDGTAAVQRDATHRYVRPGVYNVTLTITDDDLNLATATHQVVVRNAEPVAEFEYLPRIVTTDGLVQFTDRSLDMDGLVTNWTWTFGDDGSVSYARHPSHRFTRAGPIDVTLTATDDLGGRTTTTKSVNVRNSPPVAEFTYAPHQILSNTPVRFTSGSFDKDGTIVSWEWNFGDSPKNKGVQAFGPDVTHVFKRPGTYNVVLTVTDDMGDVDALGVQLAVVNVAADVSFEFSFPEGNGAGRPVVFESTTVDSDGFIVLNEWDFGDGTDTHIVRAIQRCANTRDVERCEQELAYAASHDPFTPTATTGDGTIQNPPGYSPPPPVEHTYRHWANWSVELCVLDNLLLRACATQTVPLNNTAPIPDILISNPRYRHSNITFTSVSRDPDGDTPVIVGWEFDDGFLAPNLTTIGRVYAALDTHWVKLTVRDSAGLTASVTKTFTIDNQIPTVQMFVDPVTPRVHEDVDFNATFFDPDASPGPAVIRWRVGLDTIVGQNFTYNFTNPGPHTVTVNVTDGEGGVSATISRTINVQDARPDAAFTWTPARPNQGANVTFIDESTTFNPPITSWTWNFGDGTPEVTVSSPAAANVTHAFSGPGPFNVRLTVTDSTGSDTQEHTVEMNTRPTATFTYIVNGTSPPEVIFTDASIDLDGYISFREWDFGDGSTLTTNDSIVAHVYASPGNKIVKLSVVDNDGGRTNVTKVVHLDNRPPVANFVVTTPNPRANADVQFVSTGFAYDPDGNLSIAYWRWDWGDGTFSEGTDGLTLRDPVHVYARSGTYRVTLVVGDGTDLSFPITKSVRVTADHNLLVGVKGKLPTNEYANLLHPSIDVRLTLSVAGGVVVGLGKNQLGPFPDGGVFTVPEGVWAEGDTVRVTLKDNRTLEVEAMAQLLTLNDDFGKPDPVTSQPFVPVTEFIIRMPIHATIQPLAPTDDNTGILNDDDYTNDGAPIYHDMSTPFFGTGYAQYADGVPVRDGDVTIELRYLSGYIPGSDTPIRDSRTIPVPHDTTILGWCKAATTITNEDGTFGWVVDDGSSCYFPSDCLIPSLCGPDKDPIYLVGHWDVRAIVGHAGTDSARSPYKSIFVDPTGILAKTYLP